MNKIDLALIAVKKCTKALMKLSYRKFISENNFNYSDSKISDKNINNNNY